MITTITFEIVPDASLTQGILEAFAKKAADHGQTPEGRLQDLIRQDLGTDGSAEEGAA
jgi:hypothetical protein